MIDKIEALKQKLTSNNIVFEERTPADPEFPSRVIFEISAGREKFQCLLIYRETSLEEALSCDFEKFRFIFGYEAIWSKELNTIEAEITNSDFMGRYFFDRLYKLICRPEKSEEDENEVEITNVPLPKIGEVEVSIGYSSTEFVFLISGRERGPRVRHNRKITLKIRNVKVQTHENAKEILEKLANSIFFQIDLAYEIPVNLQVQRENFLERRNKRMRKLMAVDESATIKEPKYEYDNEPISLYWYAKESANMPIFQYLAYYQSIEFYFPIYSSYEAKQKIQSLIKDPRFNPNKDSDISKIISTIKMSSGGKSFGSEREQLKSTISACTNNNEFLDFFKSDEKRFNFYSEHKGKNLSKQKISVKNETSDFITEVSERIYEIRCRIVHTKSNEGNFEVLLPYSNEVKELSYDIELIEYISRKILISSSRPLKI